LYVWPSLLCLDTPRLSRAMRAPIRVIETQQERLMKATMSKATLSRQQIRTIRGELERERNRFAEHDQRYHVFAEALRRLGENSYGSCVVCQAGIPYARLMVMPETLYCVGCGARA
jgi:RNA polymerase-binding transcription factor DksA